MFGWGKKKEAPKASKPRADGLNLDELAALGVDISHFQGLADDGEDDADLEAELASFNAPAPHKPSAPKKKPAAPPSAAPNVDAILKNAAQEENYDHIEVDDDDLDDPELMSELHALGGGPPPPARAPPAAPAPMADIQPSRPAPPPRPYVAPPPPRPTVEPMQVDLGYRQQPLGGAPTPMSNPPAPARTAAAPQPSSAPPARPSPAANAPTSEAAPPRSSAANDLALVKARQGEYRSAAVAAKKSGDQDMAIKMMHVYKSIGELVEQLNAGFPFDAKSLPPPPGVALQQLKATPSRGAPAAGNASAAPVKAPSSTAPQPKPPTAAPAPAPAVAAPIPSRRATTPTVSKEDLRMQEISGASSMARLSVAGDDVYSQLELQLQDQSATCSDYAKMFLTQGNKEQALKYHKMSKAFQQDILLVKNAQVQGQAPHASYFTHSLQTSRSFPELKPTDMELFVSGCVNLSKEAVDYSATIQWDMGFPNSEQPQTGTIPSGGRTPNPKMEYVALLVIDRRKTFQRFISRRFIEFTLSYKTLFKKKTLGMARVPLAAFSEKCEISCKAEFLDENRRGTAAYIDVRLRIRSPLDKEEVVEESHRWVQIGHADSAAAPVRATQPPAAAPRPVSTSSTQAQQQQRPSRSSVPAAPAPASAAEDDEEDDEGNPDDAAWIMKYPSNDVLEWMVEDCDKKIAACRASKQPFDDLVERKQAAQTSIDLLVLRMSSPGAPTEADYLAKLREQVGQEKALALRLKARGKVEWATLAMVRAKVMMGELRSINPDEPDIKPALQPASAPAHQTATPAAQHPPPEPKPRTPLPQAPQTAPQAVQPQPPPPQPRAPAPQAATVASSAPAAAGLQDGEGDPDSVSDYVSNEVLDWVIETGTSEMQACKSQGRPVPPELEDRVEAARFKQEMITLSVSMGTLTLPQYKAQLQKAIADEKNLAARLKRANNVPWAILALQRAKIMEKEVQEIPDE